MLDPTLHYMLLIGHNSLIAKKTRVKTVKYFLHVPRNHSSITSYYKSTRKLHFNSKYRIEYFRIAVFSMQCGRLQAQSLVGAFAYITHMYISKYLCSIYLCSRRRREQQRVEQQALLVFQALAIFTQVRKLRWSLSLSCAFLLKSLAYGQET